MDSLLFGVEWKAATGSGELEGYMSVFNNVDQDGDVVLPGAFKKTFADWNGAKSKMPLIDQHQLTSDGVIGSVTHMAEDGYGAKIRAKFSSIQKAQDIRLKMIEGHLNGLSYTYEPVRSHRGTFSGKSVRFLDEVKASDPKKPYGDVTYADPGYQSDGVHRYPLDSEAHCRAAWSYINQAGNGGKYSSEELSLIKGRIRSALKKYGVTVAESSSLDLATALNVAEKIFAIPLLSARKAALSDLAEYDLDDPAAEPADEQPTADAAADTGEPADGTADKASAYALSVIHPPEPRDDALDPLAVLRLAQDSAEADRLEAQILNARGGH